MPKDMLLSLARESRDTITANLVRMPNPDSMPYILRGCPTKDLNIKGKTSEFPLVKGMIPVDQELSKMAGRTKAAIQGANESVQRCIKSGHAVAMKLIVPAQEIDRAVESGNLKITRSMRGLVLEFALPEDERKPGKPRKLTYLAAPLAHRNDDKVEQYALYLIKRERPDRSSRSTRQGRLGENRVSGVTATDDWNTVARNAGKNGKTPAVSSKAARRASDDLFLQPLEVLARKVGDELMPIVADFDLAASAPFVGMHNQYDMPQTGTELIRKLSVKTDDGRMVLPAAVTNRPDSSPLLPDPGFQFGTPGNSADGNNAASLHLSPVPMTSSPIALDAGQRPSLHLDTLVPPASVLTRRRSVPGYSSPSLPSATGSSGGRSPRTHTERRERVQRVAPPSSWRGAARQGSTQSLESPGMLARSSSTHSETEGMVWDSPSSESSKLPGGFGRRQSLPLPTGPETQRNASPAASLSGGRRLSTISTDSASSAGVLTMRQFANLTGLNRAAGRDALNPVFHHGTEENNPYTNFEDMYPLICFVPSSKDPSKPDADDEGMIVIAKTEEELIELWRVLRTMGYMLSPNPKWPADIRAKLQPFGQASAARKLSNAFVPDVYLNRLESHLNRRDSMAEGMSAADPVANSTAASATAEYPPPVHTPNWGTFTLENPFAAGAQLTVPPAAVPMVGPNDLSPVDDNTLGRRPTLPQRRQSAPVLTTPGQSTSFNQAFEMGAAANPLTPTETGITASPISAVEPRLPTIPESRRMGGNRSGSDSPDSKSDSSNGASSSRPAPITPGSQSD